MLNLGVKQILRVKVFRRKMMIVLSVVICMAVFFIILAYNQMKDEWIYSSQREAEEYKRGIEEQLREEERFLDIQLTGLYSSRELWEDMECMMTSDSKEAYLTKRLEKSVSTMLSIRSFPSYIKEYIRKYDNALYKVALNSGNQRNLFFCNQGNIELEFGRGDWTPELKMDITENIVIAKEVYDLYSNYKIMGNLLFFYDIDELTGGKEMLSQLRGAALTDREGNFYRLKGNTEKLGTLIDNIEDRNNNTGSVNTGVFNTLYYGMMESEEYDYKLVFYTDDYLLLENHGNKMIPLIIIIVLISVGFIILFFMNMRSDYKFITRIYAAIESVNKAEFEDREEEKLMYHGTNEYAHIAHELNVMSYKLKRHILKEYQLKIEQQKTQMRVLQNQINPHFLYNTLEVIRSIALVNDDKRAADALSALGSLYRDVVKGSENCTFADELNLLEKYLKIMEFKSTGNFFYQINVEAEMMNLPTVKFWMQPLSENFFVHGFHAEREYNVLIIEGKCIDNGFLFEMIDNGNGIAEDEIDSINQQLLNVEAGGESIGLSNVYKRLRYFYGRELNMKITNNPEGGARICIFIPKGAGNDV